MIKYGSTVGKILNILANGFVLSLSKDKRERFRLHKECDRLWYTIDRKQLYQILKRLRMEGFVKVIKHGNNIEKIQIDEKGKKRWLRYQFNDLELKPLKRWDKKWRIVLFDIPEVQKKIRDALRRKLKNLGFLEFQKSVFIYPHPCKDEVNFIINFFNIEDYVYYLEAPISSDYNFRQYFHLK
jgi:DNA-binding transcriptional regulator PaaX